MMRIWITVLAALAFAAPGAALNRETHLTIRAEYTASVLIFRVGRVSFNAELGPQDYSAQSHVRAAGLAALFTDFTIDSHVTGGFDNNQPRPWSYAHIEQTGSKTRQVDVAFRSGIAQSTAAPAFSSLGAPPASEADRTGVLDPLSAILQVAEMIASSEADPCTALVPVFDGKQRYNLNFISRGRERIRTRGWQGEAIICDAFYEPVSGYDPEDWPEPGETRHPLRLWFAPVADGLAYLPVRAHTRAGFGGVTIELREFTLE